MVIESAFKPSGGQRGMVAGELKKKANPPPAISGQRVPMRSALPKWMVVICGVLVGLVGFGTTTASGPLIDPLDGQPLRWRLTDADCQLNIPAQWLDAAGGLQGKPCEAITIVAGHGTQVILEYRLEPSMAIEDVRATIALKSISAGPRVGLRICYPRILDPVTRAPKTIVLWGDSHGGRGQWEVLAVSPKVSQRRLSEMALREQFGPTADLRDCYIDAVVLNAYAGAGSYTMRLDQLRVDGLITVNSPRKADANGSQTVRRGGAGDVDPSGVLLETERLSSVQSAFPAGRVTRVIEYNGESLAYLKLMGFDGILLSRPPTAAQLRDAVEQAMLVYAPPPQSRDPSLEPFLSAVAGWYLGTSTDETQLRLVASDQQRIEALGPLWQRPLMVAPAERWNRYAGVATTLIYDLPPSIRGIDGGEEIDLLVDQIARTGRPVIAAAGVLTLPPQRFVDQMDALGRSLGAIPVEDYGWRTTWLQTARGLSIAPRGIFFRSGRSLESGREIDARRATVLGMVNRWIEVVGPLVGDSRFRGTLNTDNPSYKLAHLSASGAELVIATHRDSPATDPAAVNTDSPLVFRIPLGENSFAWRITDTTVEQLRIGGDATTRQLEIENPDLVEWIVTSNDPGLGGRLDRMVRRQAALLNQYRWDLVSESLMRSREDWRSAVAGGLVPRGAIPEELLRTAAQLLAEVQPRLAAGDVGSAMRATRAADAIGWRCESLLTGRLRPAGLDANSMPALLAPGGVPLQIAWLPSIGDGRWTDNLLAGGNLDRADELLRTGWTYQTRLEEDAVSAVGIDPQTGETGSGALRIEAAGRGAVPLAGGYAGTVARVTSAATTCPPGSWVRIQARVRTLGFGGPNQGLLIYDNDGGSAMGTLVPGNTSWKTVTLYRTITGNRPLTITFEGIGGGEATIDWVHVAMWKPPTPPPQFRPLR
jgi:hypothetical protein